jgi:hypothetical protein
LIDGGSEALLSDGSRIAARIVLLCPYARLNTTLQACGAAPIPMRQELVEIALIHPPPQLAEASWTIMDGPFCSSLPFPTANARSLYHVQYSVHATWLERTADAQSPDHNALLANVCDMEPFLAGALKETFDV